MGELVVLVDIGSTFTKVAAVDLQAQRLVARSEAPTTSEDVSLGLQNALEQLESSLSRQGWGKTAISGARKLACSSAAGGLRMVAIGLVRDLTAKAARLAALGAGARVLETYAFQLTDEDLAQIIELRPDIILLAGGTDGGNSENILHNAKVLATLPWSVPVVIAGNRSVASQAAQTFPPDFDTYIAANVMPQIGKLDVEPAREAIRKVFMDKIIWAKGLNKASRLIEGIFMPTPAAVLAAGRLLSRGTIANPGWGDLLVVDVGGATTDTHSIGLGLPTRAGVVRRGLPEPLAKRTVEGDLGVRVSALSLAEAVGPERLGGELGLEPDQVMEKAAFLQGKPAFLPQNRQEEEFDQALAFHAVRLGVGRHAGQLTEVYTPSGPVWIQEGKDLSNVRTIVGTGGVLINSASPLGALSGAQQDPSLPLELRPEKPHYFLDSDYLLASGGLLGADYPQAALAVLTNSLQEHDQTRRD